jgi:hypothetical protein
MLEIVECLGGVCGIRPSMEAYIDRPMRHALFEALHRHNTKKHRNSPDFPKILYDYAGGKILADIALGTYREIIDLTVDNIPNTIVEVGMLVGIRKLAAYIGMPQRGIDTLISWRPRPLDDTEIELFKGMYKLSAKEPFKTLLFLGLDRKQVGDDCRRVWQTYYADKEKIPQQVIDSNRESKDRIYVKMFARSAWKFTETLYFLYLCIWSVGHCLYWKPFKVPSGNDDDPPRGERPQHDLVTDMVLAMTRLPRYQAFTKVIEETDGEQSVSIHKIKTKELPPERESDIETLVTQAGYDFCKKREDIEAEIRQRQAKWQGGSGSPRTRERE